MIDVDVDVNFDVWVDALGEHGCHAPRVRVAGGAAPQTPRLRGVPTDNRTILMIPRAYFSRKRIDYFL